MSAIEMEPFVMVRKVGRPRALPKHIAVMVRQKELARSLGKQWLAREQVMHDIGVAEPSSIRHMIRKARAEVGDWLCFSSEGHVFLWETTVLKDGIHWLEGDCNAWILIQGASTAYRIHVPSEEELLQDAPDVRGRGKPIRCRPLEGSGPAFWLRANFEPSPG